MSGRKDVKKLLNEDWVGHHNLWTEFTHNPSSQYSSIQWSSSDEETEKEDIRDSKLSHKLPLQRKIKSLVSAENSSLACLQSGFSDFALVRDRVIDKSINNIGELLICRKTKPRKLSRLRNDEPLSPKEGVCDPNEVVPGYVKVPGEEEEEEDVASPVIGSQSFLSVKRIKTEQDCGLMEQEHERSSSPVLRCVTQDNGRSTSPVLKCVIQDHERTPSPLLRCVTQEHERSPSPVTQEHEKSQIPILSCDNHECEKPVSSGFGCMKQKSARSVSPVLGSAKHEIERSTSPVLGIHKRRREEVNVYKKSSCGNYQTMGYSCRSTIMRNRGESDSMQNACREDAVNKDLESVIHRKVKSHLSTTFQRASLDDCRGLVEERLYSSETFPEKKRYVCNEGTLHTPDDIKCLAIPQRSTRKNEHMAWVDGKEIVGSVKKGLEEAPSNPSDSQTTLERQHKTLSLSFIKEKVVIREKVDMDEETKVLLNIALDQNYCEGGSQIEAIDHCHTPEKIEESVFDESVTEITTDPETEEVKNELDQKCQSSVEIGQKGSAWLWYLQQQTPEKRDKGSADLDEPPDSTKKRFKKNGHATKFRRLLHSWRSGIHMWQFQMAKAKQKECIPGSIPCAPYSTSSSDLQEQPVVEIRETPKYSRKLFKVAEMKISSPSSTLSLPTKVMTPQPPKRFAALCTPAAFPVLASSSKEEGKEQLLQLKVVQVGGMLPLCGVICVKYEAVEESHMRKTKQKLYVLVLGLKENKWKAYPAVNELIEVYAPWQQLNLPNCDNPVIFSNYYIVEKQSQYQGRPSNEQEPDASHEQKLCVRNHSTRKQGLKKRIIIATWVCPCCCGELTTADCSLSSPASQKYRFRRDVFTRDDGRTSGHDYKIKTTCTKGIKKYSFL